MTLMNAVIKRVYGKELTLRETGNSVKKLVSSLNKYLAEHEFLSWLLKISFALAIAAFIWFLVHAYNRFSTLSTKCAAYFAQIGVELKRRNNLIPNLALAVQKSAAHEKDVFKHVSNAREILTQAKDINLNRQEPEKINSVLSRLLALVEQYPNLKVSISVQELIKELSNTENRIATQKAKYNAAAEEFNRLYTVFPTNILGRIYKYPKPMPYVSIEEDLLKTPTIQEKTNSIERNIGITEVSNE